MSVPLAALWLPILLSGIAVFFVSSLIWTVIQYHSADWRKLPDEDDARSALRGTAVGQYSLPHVADNAARASEEWQSKYREGPVAMITIMPHGDLKMGKQLGLWLAWCILVSLFVAYVAGTTLPAGTDYLKVFQVTSTTGLLAYGGGAGMNMVWFGATAGRTARDLLDAVIYGLVTAGFFGWLWPAAM
jgi:hypothetical protein